MMLSLSISAFAADAVVASGTIQNSGIRWELNGNGWLTISGSGETPVFTSADDQPWAEYREQITEIWYDDMEALTIPDLAYWFEGCSNLTTAELPLAPVIGRHAFYGCDKLNTITMYTAKLCLNPSVKMRSGAKPTLATRSISPTLLAIRMRRCRSIPTIGQHPTVAADISMICTAYTPTQTAQHPLHRNPV